MTELPGNIADGFISYLSEENPALDERQARLDFVAAIHTAAAQGVSPAHSRGRPPTSLYVLAVLMAQIIFRHNGKLLGRSTTGGTHAHLLLGMADSGGLVDPATGKGYVLQQAADAIQSVRRALNRSLGLEKLKFKRSEDVAGDLGENESADDYNDAIHAKRIGQARKRILGAQLETRIVCEDDDEQPIFGGYEPARERRPADEMFKDALAKQDTDD